MPIREHARHRLPVNSPGEGRLFVGPTAYRLQQRVRKFILAVDRQ